MRYYAVIDTNVLVSAMLKWKSVPGSVLELVLNGLIVPVVNRTIISEYEQVLARPKFHLPKDIISDVIGDICEKAEFIEPEHLNIAMPDPDDRVFYEVAIAMRKTKSAYLITGNIRHFPMDSFVVTPRQMLEIIMALDSEDSMNL